MLARYLIGDVARDTNLLYEKLGIGFGIGLPSQKHFGGDVIRKDSPMVAGFITARAEKILVH